MFFSNELNIEDASGENQEAFNVAMVTCKTKISSM